MAEDTVSAVKARLSIVDVVSEYVKLQRAGQNMRARCPFHAERSPSFFVSPERGTYHCFGCDKGGDIFSFVEEIEGIDFKGALKILAERAGVPLVYGRGESRNKDEKDKLFELMETAAIFYASRLTDDVTAYLKKRGLSEKTIAAFRIGFAGDGWDTACNHLKEKKFREKEILDAGIGKRGERGILDKFRNRIMFPITDSAGRVIAFSGRTFGDHAHPDAPKYLNSPETELFKKSHVLYGFDRAKSAMRKYDFAILVEGQMDLLLSHEAGFTNTVAASGTACTEEHTKLIKRITENLVIALDADEAGIKAAGRAAHLALRAGLHVKVAAMPEGVDPADLIVTRGKEEWRLAIKNSTDIISFFLTLIEKHAKNPEQFRRRVEVGVLPFLVDVQSPIDREHHVKEIARRLHVSEDAIIEATRRLPKENPPGARETEEVSSSPRRTPLGAEEAYAILVWQENVSKPFIDCAWYRKELKEAVGDEAFKTLESMPADRLEALRFKVDDLYRDVHTLATSIKKILVILRRARLSLELAEVTAALHRAEEVGDEKAVQQLLTQSKGVTKHIAELAKRE